MDSHTTLLLDGRYRLVERLGAGGMAVVMRGYDEVLGRQVAVKLLAPALAADEVFRRRLRAEAQAAARLCHPHITNVYDYGDAGGTVPYVVMELVDGQPLAARLAGGAALPWREAVVAGAEVAGALAAAHARGVVHRDITPGNVMLTATGAKVLDFGIAALAGESEIGPDGGLLGTPAYLAPERLDGDPVTPATDVYALGVLLYRSLAGRLPWRAATTTQLLAAHRTAAPRPLPPVDGLPDEVADLCTRCLAKRPGDRPTSAQVARALADTVGIIAVVPVSPAAGPDSCGSGDDELTAASTTILPPPRVPAAMATTRPVPRTGARRAPAARRPAGSARVPDGSRRPSGIAGVRDWRPGRRGAEALVVAAGLVAMAGAIWAVTIRTPAEVPSASGGRAAEPGTRPRECRVDYQVRRDTGAGRTFAAAVTVTNTGRDAVQGWQLRFTFPGHQVLTGGAGGDWMQSGQAVGLRPTPAGARLPAGASARFTVTGRHTGTNPLPVAFDLDGSPCEAVVSGLDGGPDPERGATGPARPGSGAGAGAGEPTADGPGKPKKSQKGPKKPRQDGKRDGDRTGPPGSAPGDLIPLPRHGASHA